MGKAGGGRARLLRGNVGGSAARREPAAIRLLVSRFLCATSRANAKQRAERRVAQAREAAEYGIARAHTPYIGGNIVSVVHQGPGRTMRMQAMEKAWKARLW